MPYVRPYGAQAPWNRPITGLPVHSQSTFYRDKLWTIGSNVAGNINLRYVDFTYPVYEATAATGTRTVASTGGSSNWNGQSVPFNPAWVAAPGTDAQMIILDPATGEEWNFFGITSIDATTINCVRCNRITVNDDGTGGAASYFTKTNGFQPSRGIGIQYMAMLVRPDEISENGVIEHALSMPVKNTHCTVSVPPATKVEGSAACNADGIPEGLRFGLNITEADIDTWLNALPADVPTTMKDTLRVIGRALRDYGWFVTDTSGSAGLQLEARASAAAKWDALGMAEFTSAIDFKVYPQDALDGLFTQSRIYAVVPSDEYPPMTTYFVKNGGNNANSGLDDTNAWATVGKVNSAALNVGDIVQFKCGSVWAETLTVKSGVTYQNYSTGAFPKLTGNGTQASVIIASVSNATLKDIDIVDGEHEGVWASDSNFITLNNVKISNNAQDQSSFVPNLYAQWSNDWTVKSCTITFSNGTDNCYHRDCHRWSYDLCTITDPGPTSGDNLQFTGCSSPSITNSTIGGTIDSGKGSIIIHDFKEGSTGGYIFNNVISGGNFGVATVQKNVRIEQNKFSGIGLGSGWGSALWSYITNESLGVVTGLVFTNNLVTGCNRYITNDSATGSGTYGWSITFNTLVGPTTDGQPWMGFGPGTVTGEFRRNIVKNMQTSRALGPANTTNFSIRENFYENTLNAPFGETGSLTGNAQLDVNYIPATGSPAVGYGYSGSASTGGPPSPPPPPPAPPPSPPPSTVLSYYQLMTVVRDANFLKRVEIASTRVARTVLEESTGTTDHAARLALAKRVLTKSFPFDLMGTFIVADTTFNANLTVQSTGVTAGTDSQIEAIISGLWTSVAKGLVSGN